MNKESGTVEWVWSSHDELWSPADTPWNRETTKLMITTMKLIKSEKLMSKEGQSEDEKEAQHLLRECIYSLNAYIEYRDKKGKQDE